MQRFQHELFETLGFKLLPLTNPQNAINLYSFLSKYHGATPIIVKVDGYSKVYLDSIEMAPFSLELSNAQKVQELITLFLEGGLEYIQGHLLKHTLKYLPPTQKVKSVVVSIPRNPDLVKRTIVKIPLVFGNVKLLSVVGYTKATWMKAGYFSTYTRTEKGWVHLVGDEVKNVDIMDVMGGLEKEACMLVYKV